MKTSQLTLQPQQTKWPVQSLINLLIAACLFLISTNAGAARRYVDSANVSGTYTGVSWAAAYNRLEDGIGNASAGDTVWVAKGTYKPGIYSTYSMKNGVAIYGGFANTDTGISQRNWKTRITILKGNGAGVIANLYSAGAPLLNTAVLDGFTITGGSNINGGAGINNNYASPVLRNLIISDNIASGGGYIAGGGMSNNYGAPIVTNVTFLRNKAISSGFQGRGGAVFNMNSSPVFTNIVLADNRAESSSGSNCFSLGGGMYNISSSVTVNNAVFSKNVCYSTSTASNTLGGGLYSTANTITTPLLLTNVVFIGDSAIYGGAMLTNNNYSVITNCTFASNKGAFQGFYAQESGIKVTNCAFYNHNYGDILLAGVAKSTEINYCFSGSSFGTAPYTGTGNIASSGANPFFDINNPAGPDGIWMTADDGLRLYYNAPAAPIDQGQTINASAFPAAIVLAAASDIIGTPRPIGSGYDIGAYEGGVQGPTIYVDSARVTGIHNGLSWATAFNKLEDALDTAVSNSGNPIWVAKGTYQPPAGQAYGMNINNKIYGGFTNTDTSMQQRNWAVNKTVLKGNGSRVIYNNYYGSGKYINANVVLDGFTITGGIGGDGGGMYLTGSWPTLRNLIFSNNVANGSGGGLCVGSGNDSYPTHMALYNVSFLNNTASVNGGGMATLAPLTFDLDHVLFKNNRAAQGGGGLAQTTSNLVANNVVFENDTATNGGAYYNYYQCSSKFTNTVFRANRASGAAATIYSNQYGDATMTNTTFSNNTSADNLLFVNVYFPQRTSYIKATNTVFWGNAAISGAGTDSLTYCLLQAAKPGVGNEVALLSPFVNDTLPAGADGIWMNADDGLQLKYGILPSSINSGKTIIAADNPSPVNGVSAGIAAAATKDITGLSRPSGNAYDKGAYEFKYPTFTRYYVDSANVNGLHDGMSWGTAFNNMEAALKDPSLVAGDTVWVAKGTYQPAAGNSFKMVKGVVMYGGLRNTDTGLIRRNYSTNPSILKGNGNVVINNTFASTAPMTGTAILDGFTIRDGDGSDSYLGGGIYLEYASPTLRNLLITHNSAANGYGGGISTYYSNSIINHVTVDSNSADYGGGGIANYFSALVVSNSVISGNVSLFAGGGGVDNYASPIMLSNVAFFRNTTAGDGGGMYNAGDNTPPVLKNVIFYGNTAVNGGGLAGDGSSMKVVNTTFCNNTATTNGGGAYFVNGVSANSPQFTNSTFWGNVNGNGPTGNPDIKADLVKINYCFTQKDYSAGQTGNILGSASPFVNDTLPTGYDGVWFTADDGLQLQFCTPALNAGINDSTASILTDVLGRPRIKNTVVDMGAYEKQSNTTAGLYSGNVSLSTSSANNHPFPAICDDNGWTYYAVASQPDSLAFAINWGTNNNAAKAAARIFVNLENDNINQANASGGNFVMRRYWNVDLNGTTLASPVQVRFYYNPADTVALHASAVAASLGSRAGNIQWFKTTGTLFTPAQVTAGNINGGNRINLSFTYGADNNVPYAQFSAVTSFSGGTAALIIPSSTPLPVKLLSFTARKYNGEQSVLTKWQVTAEDLDHYAVQRSTDAINFKEIGRVGPSGKEVYSLVDDLSDIPVSQRTTLYYRLLLMDASGAYTYSNTEKVSFGNAAGKATASPNPARNTLIVSNTSEALDGREVVITDAKGIMVQRFILTGRISLDVSRWQPGIYFLKTADGQVLKIVRE